MSRRHTEQINQPTDNPTYWFPYTSDANDVVQGLQAYSANGATYTQDGAYLTGSSSSGFVYNIPSMLSCREVVLDFKPDTVTQDICMFAIGSVGYYFGAYVWKSSKKFESSVQYNRSALTPTYKADWPVVTSGEWHKLRLVNDWSADTFSVYLDDVLMATYPHSWSSFTAKAFVGRLTDQYSTIRHFKGYIKDVKMYA